MKPKPRQPDSFNDFLGLANQSFEKERLLVFHGTSGSGKSANLKFLADHHPQFHSQETPWIWTMGKNFDPSGVRGHRLVAVDEIISPFNFQGCLNCSKPTKRWPLPLTCIPSGSKSSDPPCPSVPFRPIGRAKLRAYLQAKGVRVLGRGSPKFSQGLPGQLRRTAMHPRAQPRTEPRPCAELQPEIRQNHDFQKKGLDAHPPSFEVPLKVFDPSFIFSFAKNEMLR